MLGNNDTAQKVTTQECCKLQHFTVPVSNRMYSFKYLRLKIQVQIKTQIQAYFLTVEMMQWQLKRLVVLELWRTHTKLLGLPHFRKILDIFALFSAAFNHTSHFLGRVLLSSVFYQPFSEAAIMFVGLREVGWVGPEQEAVYGGLLLMAACPQLILSHDFHSSCSGHQEPHLLPHRPPTQGAPKS